MTTHPASCSRTGSGVTAVALVLIAVGVLLLLDNFGILWMITCGTSGRWL